MYSSTTFTASCKGRDLHHQSLRVSLRLCNPYEIAPVCSAVKLSGLIGGPWGKTIKTSQHREGRLTQRIGKVIWTLRSPHRHGHHQSCECISLFPPVTLQSFCALLSYWGFFLFCFFALSALKAETKHQFHLNDSPLSAGFGHIATTCRLQIKKFATGRLTCHHLSGLNQTLSMAPHP